MLSAARQSRLDKRVNGGKSELHRCSGAAIVDGVKGARERPLLVRACQHKTKERHVTGAMIDHTQCSGQAAEKEEEGLREVVGGRGFRVDPCEE